MTVTALLAPGFDVPAILAGLAVGAVCMCIAFGVSAGLTVIRRFLEVD